MIKYFHILTLCLMPAIAIAMESAPKKSSAAAEIVSQLRAQQAQGGSTDKEIKELREKFNSLKTKYSLLKLENQNLKGKISSINAIAPIPVPVSISPLVEPQKKRQKVVEKPCFNCSPSPVKSVVYLMYTTFEDNASLIAKSDRIDASNLKVGPMNEQNLNAALLEMELKILNLIDRSMVSRVIYVGLTKNALEDRFDGHFRDVFDDEIKEFSSNKVIHIRRALDVSLNVKVSHLVENIPEEYLNLVEALVSYLFLAQENGGSARIANRAAWGRFLEYYHSPERHQDLKTHRLESKILDIAKQLLSAKLMIML